MNKKGQEVGKIISTFPVAIIIFLIMTGFIVLTGFISLGNKNTENFYPNPQNSILLKTIDYDGKEVIFFDKIYTLVSTNKLEDSNEIRELISKVVAEDDKCFMMFSEEFSSDALIYSCRMIDDGNQDKESLISEGQKKVCENFVQKEANFESIIERYGSKVEKMSFVAGENANEIHNIIYYYGGCVNE